MSEGFVVEFFPASTAAARTRSNDPSCWSLKNKSLHAKRKTLVMSIKGKTVGLAHLRKGGQMKKPLVFANKENKTSKEYK
jgi:hypothetical protein